MTEGNTMADHAADYTAPDDYQAPDLLNTQDDSASPTGEQLEQAVLTAQVRQQIALADRAEAEAALAAGKLAPSERYIPSPAVRRWLYALVAAAGAVAVVYGLATPEQSAVWLEAAGLVLVVTNGLAAANTKR